MLKKIALIIATTIATAYLVFALFFFNSCQLLGVVLYSLPQ